MTRLANTKLNRSSATRMHKNLGAAGLVLLSVGHQAVENCRFMTPLIGLVGWPPLPTDWPWPSSSVAVSRKTRLQVVRTKNRQWPVSTVSTVSRLPHHLIDKYETSARDQQQPAELTLLEYRYLERDREMRQLLFFSL